MTTKPDITNKEAAAKLWGNGVASLPVIGKIPPKGLMWRNVGRQEYGHHTVNEWYSHGHDGLAVLGGRISGGLIVLDFDLKNTDDKELFDKVFNELTEQLPEFTDWSTVVQTPSGGYHVYLRCDEIEPNQPLAKAADGKVTIETRGEGGYAVTYPSPGYDLVQGGLESFAYKVTPEQKDLIFSICRSFSEYLDPKEHQRAMRTAVNRPDRYITNPFDDFNERVGDDFIRELIEEAGFLKAYERGKRDFYKRIGSDNPQSANFHAEKRLFYTWSGNSVLQPNKAYKPSFLLRDVRFAGNGKETYKWLISNGYGRRIGQEDEQAIKDIKTDLLNGKTPEDILLDRGLDHEPQDLFRYIEIAGNRIQNDDEVFWSIKKKDDDTVELKVFKNQLLTWLGNRNYRLLMTDNTGRNKMVVKLDPETHTIRIVETVHIKQDIAAWLDTLDIEEDVQAMIMERLLNISANFFSEKIWEWLKGVVIGEDIKIKRDGPTESYFFFRNGYLVINKKTIELKNYIDMDPKEYIWENEIKKVDFRSMDLMNKEVLNQCEWYLFVKRLCNLGPDTDSMDFGQLAENKPEQWERLAAFMATIGYLCHNYNDPAKAFAVIIAEDISDSNAGGGTGKGLFAKSFRHIRPALIKPGKTWDPKSEFAFNNWNESIRYMVIEDVDRRFKFELMYNTITDGMDLRRLYAGTVFVEFSDLPKFVFTTNYGDFAAGAQHGERRRKMLLVGSYFGPDKTPRDEFSHDLFDGWDDKQWILFFNFMAECTNFYFNQGVIGFPNSENMAIKTFLTKYSEELLDYLMQYAESIEDPFYTPQLLKDIRDKFTEQNPKQNYSPQRFKEAFKMFCNISGYEMVESKGTERSNKRLAIIELKKVKND